MISIEIVPFGSDHYHWASRLREKELRGPLGLTLSEADIDGEHAHIHFVACIDGVRGGACIIRPDGNGVYQLRQMVVDTAYRGLGVGKRMIQYYEAHLFGIDCVTIWMQARLVAKPFYEINGYTASGDVFDKVGIPHIYMDKQISEDTDIRSR